MRSSPTTARRCAHSEIRRIRSTHAVLLASIVSSLATRAAADAGIVQRGDPTDTLSLMRVADDAGHAQLEARLRGSVDREAVVVAVRASVFAAAPERLVPALAALACGRDPDLAPEAALSIAAIAPRLVPSELAAREVLRDELREARAALACPRDAPPRLDVVVAMQTLAATLDALLR